MVTRRQPTAGLVAAAALAAASRVALYCASVGLATVFRGSVDYPKLEHALRLPDQPLVTFAQTVGYARLTVARTGYR